MGISRPWLGKVVCVFRSWAGIFTKVWIGDMHVNVSWSLSFWAILVTSSESNNFPFFYNELRQIFKYSKYNMRFTLIGFKWYNILKWWPFSGPKEIKFSIFLPYLYTIYEEFINQRLQNLIRSDRFFQSDPIGFLSLRFDQNLQIWSGFWKRSVELCYQVCSFWYFISRF